ncbi:MAG: putative sulfate exporter family transporter [Alphaproteobacteria bacterium]
MTVNRKWTSGMASTEDWWAVWLGLFMFFAGLASIGDVDLVGWMAKTKTWTDLSKSLAPAGKAYADWTPLASLLMTYAVFTVLTGIGAATMKLDVRKFLLGWTTLFAITWVVWIVGHEAHLAAPVNKWEKYGITWGLSLGGGASYILALAVGLVIGNFVKPLARFLQEAAKPEWFIKTAIVYLGIKIGVMSMQAAGFAFELALAGACATFVAYLLFWPLIYALARKAFKLPRQWAAVLSSGISVCGVSAAIATGGAIRAKPVIPVMVSMLIVIYAMIELIVLPGFYTWAAPDQPIVNGAAMGMTVKTDGADAAAGAILDELMRAQAALAGVFWEEGWILTASIMTKIWIDMFIGVWAFLLALVWVYKVERAPGQRAIGPSEIWLRFPKFVLGYLLCWFAYTAIALFWPDVMEAARVGAKTVESPMRKMMFMLTFVAMGVITDFAKLKGMGRLALLYGLSLVFIIAPTAYVVAWIFHRGMMPPTVAG